jgi:hypothetical protein
MPQEERRVFFRQAEDNVTWFCSRALTFYFKKERRSDNKYSVRLICGRSSVFLCVVGSRHDRSRGRTSGERTKKKDFSDELVAKTSRVVRATNRFDSLSCYYVSEEMVPVLDLGCTLRQWNEKKCAKAFIHAT